ncbi:MAG: hypothetical protein C5B50_10325 [Verrucomicrobia bacterium]|nr:MAG: hypothetical protein C5B50_10325 [Verrucomicrobiota bacterium]
MKRNSTNSKPRANGTLHTRAELLAAHRRALNAVGKMTAEERFELLVGAGIVSRTGKLTKRYGGRAKNKPFVW